ncbi:MAG: hypothetical protein RIT45_162 [Pseudomonadota bacterium]|jgi:uncharacterized protein YndB with AHSA1/START domain
MSLESFELHVQLGTPPDQVYQAWLDAEEHTDFTGGEATVDPRVGGVFTAGDGYIQGRTLELEPERRIVQSWRTSDFEETDADSRLELFFDADGEGGCKLTLRHTDLPAGQGARYEQGWREFYFTPMVEYFAALDDVVAMLHDL